jgi:hypothetical protein
VQKTVKYLKLVVQFPSLSVRLVSTIWWAARNLSGEYHVVFLETDGFGGCRHNDRRPGAKLQGTSGSQGQCDAAFAKHTISEFH